ncbi:unnamed protein product [Aphanomyces euteiches]|uniref:Uncharacterized protein n=1 Tax=Aphanomyces euteiches TaxID=100861 RepID=A0A6G0XQC6_9STRA|nr:hypothetical protein Ae201684_002436 [Aphanomyces euteiches]
MPPYLVYFYHRYLDFRLPELDAVLKIYGIDDTSSVYKAPEVVEGETPPPFLQLSLPSDDIAAKVAARCVLIKGIYTFLAVSQSYDELKDKLKAEYCNTSLHPADATWSFWVDCFGQKLSLAEQDQRRQRITSTIDFPGVVQLKNADCAYWLFEEKGIETDERDKVKRLYFARQLHRTLPTRTARQYVDKHKLKKRKFIGPTSMDHELSLLMANLALVAPNSFVCDPFVGTASVLIACAQFGAICLGGDIDAQALHGTSGSANINSNFDQYSLPLPELVNWDISHAAIRAPSTSWFDAILCDPPYGLRESAHVSGQSNAIAPHRILASLLEYAATSLVIGGRLVYVMACQKRPSNDYAQHK